MKRNSPLYKRLRNKKGLFTRFFRRERFWLSFSGLVILLISILLVWLLWALFTYLAYDGTNTSGPAGDKFGGITALFSGLAFAGLIFTLFVQKKELQYQREELSHLVDEQRETKIHLKDQATHLLSQSKSVERQVFENTFFQMLDTFNRNAEKISIKVGSKELVGNQAFRHLHSRLNAHVNGSCNADEAFYPIMRDFGAETTPYFRQLYYLLKFIKNSDMPDRRLYSNFLRAQLSDHELDLIFCNGATDDGKAKFAPLMREFDFLKHFHNDKIISKGGKFVEFYEGWDFVAKFNSPESNS